MVPSGSTLSSARTYLLLKKHLLLTWRVLPIYANLNPSASFGTKLRQISTLVLQKSNGVFAAYEDLVQKNVIKLDARQRSLAKGLDGLERFLSKYKPPHAVKELKVAYNSRGVLGKLGDPNIEHMLTGLTSLKPRGLYIWGDVGTGKSMLLDMFHKSCPVPVRRKRRVHFHSFMLEVHDRIHQWKKRDLKVHGRSRHLDLRPERDAIKQVAAMISREAWVLCFDEFQVTDIADAIIMTRLFGELFRQGTVLIATSNRPPRDLYKDGLNRHDFLPFIDALKEQCVVFSMKSNKDYRKLTQAGQAKGQYLWPLSQKAREKVDMDFEAAKKSFSQEEVTVQVMMGRKLVCPSVAGDTCRFRFEDLCDREVGAADYRALCENFSTLILEDIPALSLKDHNKARRFITLVDELYEHGTSLICTADLPPEKIFSGGFSIDILDDDTSTPVDGNEAMPSTLDAAQEITFQDGELESVRELRFAFKRAVSRIHELCNISRVTES